MSIAKFPSGPPQIQIKHEKTATARIPETVTGKWGFFNAAVVNGKTFSIALHSLSLKLMFSAAELFDLSQTQHAALFEEDAPAWRMLSGLQEYLRHMKK